MDIVYVLFIIVGVWLLAISAFLIFVYLKIKRLIGQANGKDVLTLVNRVLKDGKKIETELTGLKGEINIIREKDLVHLQKMGLIRFNPFNETGGDHSFSLAILDGMDNGLVLTGLHTRERTRIYIKDIQKGKSKYSLSKEEISALAKIK